MRKNNGYNQHFYEEQKRGSLHSAEKIVPVVLDIIGEVNSVLDIGCGVGTWLSVFLKKNKNIKIIGIDGTYVDQTKLYIPKENFIPKDLSKPFDINQKFELVMSLEVAEHIPKQAAPDFINSLCQHGDLILFSAAIPGQGGTYHVNEAYPSYWSNLFSALGYYPVDDIRKLIWNQSDIDAHYRQNIMLFVKKDSQMYQKYYTLMDIPLDIIHPWFYERALNNYVYSFRQLLKIQILILKKAPGLFFKAIRRRISAH
jgi:SAM-dependent methyltransferase